MDDVEEENEVIEAKQENPNSVQEIDVPTQLLKYKELLDLGVITQDEFEAKKKSCWIYENHTIIQNL